MKIIKTIFLILSIISSIYAQIDTTIWYPLKVGNYWEYTDSNRLVHYGRLVVGDTVLTDSNTYSVILETDYITNSQHKIFRRVVDGTKIYTDQILLFDLSLSKDENWQIDSTKYRRVINEGEIFFDLTDSSYQFKEFEDLYFSEEDTSYIERKWERVYKGIGEVIIGSWGGYVELIKAKIGNKIYTKESLAEYYPLQVGNKWLYKTSTYDVGTTPNVSYHWKEVIGDTSMNNNKRYFIIKDGSREYYERFDSITNEIIRYNDSECNKIDNPIYSLNYIPNDTVEWWYCDSLGNPYQVTYREYFGADSSFIEFAKDDLVMSEVGYRKHLGLFYRSIYEVSYSTTVLIGAEINGKVWGTLTDIDDEEKIDYQFTLSQNYPNPFNPSTKIKFSIPKVETPYMASLQQTKLVIYDLLGREVKILLNKNLSPGSYEVEFDGSNLSSGIYFYELQFGGLHKIRKMILLK